MTEAEQQQLERYKERVLKYDSVIPHWLSSIIEETTDKREQKHITDFLNLLYAVRDTGALVIKETSRERSERERKEWFPKNQ
jgi:hypothetical protein